MNCTMAAAPATAVLWCCTLILFHIKLCIKLLLYHYASTAAVVASETLFYPPIIQLIQLCCFAPIIQLKLHSSRLPHSSAFAHCDYLTKLSLSFLIYSFVFVYMLIMKLMKTNKSLLYHSFIKCTPWYKIKIILWTAT